MSTPSEPSNHRFTLDLRTGRILDGTHEPPVEDIPDEDWRPIGEIEPVTGPRIDWTLAIAWRPLEEFWRP
jgi:hypothetical protein